MKHLQTRMIPVDPALKHLGTALHADKMLGVFQQRLYADKSIRIVACHIERIKYKPQKNCHVSYRLCIRDDKCNDQTEQLVCSRFYEQGGSTARFFKEKGKTSVADTLLHIPELDCVTWIFPHDRKLTHLAQIVDAGFLQRNVMPVIVAKYAGAGWSIKNFQAAMIRYVPEQSCSVRAELEIVHPDSGNRRNFVVYGKTCYNHHGQRVLQLMQQLWRCPASQEHTLHVPRPLLYQPRLRMLWQLEVPGRTLSELCGNADLFFYAIANTARQVALLHRVPLHDCPDTKPYQELQELDKVRQLLHKFNAPQRNAIILLIERLEALFSSTRPEQRATLHGDLHLKNILVDGTQVHLIDLDNISQGNPLRDIGSFIAAIINLALLGSISGQLAEQAIEVFLHAYSGVAHHSVDSRQLRNYIVLALVVERIFRSFTRLKTGRMEIIENLARQAQNILDDSFTPIWLQGGD